MNKVKVAIIGSGNIGTDLMIKVLRRSERLELAALVGIDPDSDGLQRAKRMKVETTAEGSKASSVWTYLPISRSYLTQHLLARIIITMRSFDRTESK